MLNMVFIPSGKWRHVSELVEVKDKVLLEVHTGGYILALDTGYFTVGEPKDDGRLILHCTCNIVATCVHVYTSFRLLF